jgi:pimeloyl-ACP methyl ester carboxylesterase
MDKLLGRDDCGGMLMFWCRALAVVSLVFGLAIAAPHPLSAQTPDAGTEEEEEEIPEPEDVTIPTRDGVLLAATYYGSLEGKDAVPIVCLPGFEGTRNEYAELALDLQELGYAVLTVDLRGHGDSTKLQGGGPEFDTSRLRPEHFKLMVVQDLEAVNRFLWEKNNAEELNLNKLCLIGAELGATVAANYAAHDWSIPNYGALQQGQFVKGLVLLSAEMRSKGLQMTQPMQHPAMQNQVAVMLLFGKLDRGVVGDSEKIYRRLTHSQPQPKDPKERRVFAFGIDTRLQGTKLLDPRLKTQRYIVGFLKVKLAQATGPEFQWKELKRPHQ